MLSARVVGLWIYPIKSCRGFQVSELKMGPAGPLHDRQWMLVDADNNFLTQRTHPKMAQIKTALTDKYLEIFLDQNKILIPLVEIPSKIESVIVWGDSVRAGVESDDVNQAISDFMEQTVKLVRYQKESFRELGEGKGTAAVNQTMFADSRPLLVVNTSSMEDLNQHLIAKGEKPSYIERFRANIVLEGLPAFSEDQLSKIKIGEVALTHPKLCARCPIVTLDAETGETVSKETLKTLASYRKIGNGVMFGVNFTPANLGVIRLGDTLKI